MAELLSDCCIDYCLEDHGSDFASGRRARYPQITR